MSRFWYYFFVISILISQAQAWEIDNVTCRTKPITNVIDKVNDETNRRIDAAIKAVAVRRGTRNAYFRALQMETAKVKSENGIRVSEIPNLNTVPNSKRCDKAFFVEALYNQLANPWSNNLETWAVAAEMPKCSVTTSESIYSVFDFSESMVVKSAGINPVINMNGHRVGVDKLSHFMTEGYDYMMLLRKDPNATLDDILKIGISEEEGSYGWQATGIKSYADMSANYKGYTFWKQLFDGDNPYFECTDGKWKQKRPFRWEEYVDGALDESINCNEYRTPEMNEKIDAETAKRWKAAGLEAEKCPSSVSDCKGLFNSLKPPQVLNTIIHPRCLKAGRDNTTNTLHTESHGGAQ